MKSTHIASLALAALLTISASSVRGDTDSYQESLKRRDSILLQIVAELENRRASGKADDEAVFSAKLALYRFRRDTASSKVEKLANQRKIVKECDARLARLITFAEKGSFDSLEMLRAKDAVLEANLLLQELKSSVRKV